MRNCCLEVTDFETAACARLSLSPAIKFNKMFSYFSEIPSFGGTRAEAFAIGRRANMRYGVVPEHIRAMPSIYR